MAEVKIKVEEKLGGQVSFGGKEIRVLAATYKAVPESKRDEMDMTLIKAQERYQSLVEAEKKAGRKPAASKLKAQAIEEVLTPFLNGVGAQVGKTSRGTGSSTSKEKKEKKAPVVVPKRPKEEDLTAEQLAEELDNFPAEDLSDSGKDVKPAGDFDDMIDEEDFLKEGEELAYEDEEGEGDAFEGDAFGEVSDELDLEI